MSNSISRRDRRRLETRQRIVTAAGELFGEQGVSATKVSDICAAADVAHQTFFNHFPTKAELVRELVAIGYDFVAVSAEEAQREGATTGERIARFFSRILEATIDAGPMHRDLLVESIRASHTDGGDPQGESRLRDAIGRLVHAGIAAGEVTRRHPPEDLALLVRGSFSMLMFEWASSPDYPIAERAERMARLLAHALAPAPSERRRAD